MAVAVGGTLTVLVLLLVVGGAIILVLVLNKHGQFINVATDNYDTLLIINQLYHS